MLTEIQYRTFDDLLDSIKIDLRHYDLEGMIDPQQLIKVAMKVNFELGLKINPSRSKLIEIHKGKGKLPQDMHVLNFALVCEGHNNNYTPGDVYKTYTQGLLEGVNLANQFGMYGDGTTVRQYNVVMNINGGDNIVSHNLGTTEVIVQALASDGQALAFLIEKPDVNTVVIKNPNGEMLQNVTVIVMGARRSFVGPHTELVANNTGKSVVHYNVHGKRSEYHNLIPLRIDKNKSVSADCFNVNSREKHAAVIKNGFLVTNFDEGSVYVNYQSLMEDDQGNLLVMDHPMINEFYEYALKQRIYENLFMAGENVANFLSLVEQRLRAARNNALSYVNTPDFGEMRKIWEMNRKAQYHNYYNMFKS